MMQRQHIRPLSDHLVPSVDAAVQLYHDDGGNLSPPSSFGLDPLDDNQDLLHERLAMFQVSFPGYDPLFHSLVNGNHTPFRQAVMLFASITTQLSQ